MERFDNAIGRVTRHFNGHVGRAGWYKGSDQLGQGHWCAGPSEPEQDCPFDIGHARSVLIKQVAACTIHEHLLAQKGADIPSEYLLNRLDSKLELGWVAAQALD